MTAKIRQIIDTLNAMVAFMPDKSMADGDVIATIDAICLLRNLHDSLGLDINNFHRGMDNLPSELSRRIYGKENIQLALPLIKALSLLIYDLDNAGIDSGQARWRKALMEMCGKVVAAYHEKSLIHSSEYLYALDVACRLHDDENNACLIEYKKSITSYLKDIDSVSAQEKIKRYAAYWKSHFLFVSDNWEKWAEIRESLKSADISSLDDDAFLMWLEITDFAPLKEMKKRAARSRQMLVHYLQTQAITEFRRQKSLSDKRKLERSLKTLNDEIIGDIINIKIDAGMPVSELCAIETIFSLRLQLAEAKDDDKTWIYRKLCLSRHEEIATALKTKYQSTASLNEKIEILERLSIIGAMADSHHSDFAIEEADRLKNLPGLTFAQRIRLDWIPSINSENESEIAAKLLESLSANNPLHEQNTNASTSFLPPNSSFIMGTLTLISDYCADAERQAIFNRYLDLIDTAQKSGNAAELGNLLSLAAHWNSDPRLREKIKNITAQHKIPNSCPTSTDAIPSVLIPNSVARLNPITAEIHRQIEAITHDQSYQLVSA